MNECLNDSPTLSNPFGNWRELPEGSNERAIAFYGPVALDFLNSLISPDSFPTRQRVRDALQANTQELIHGLNRHYDQERKALEQVEVSEKCMPPLSPAFHERLFTKRQVDKKRVPWFQDLLQAVVDQRTGSYSPKPPPRPRSIKSSPSKADQPPKKDKSII